MEYSDSDLDLGVSPDFDTPVPYPTPTLLLPTLAEHHHAVLAAVNWLGDSIFEAAKAKRLKRKAEMELVVGQARRRLLYLDTVTRLLEIKAWETAADIARGK